jgi:imidazolonepropionase-like amidohydrolase
MPCVYGETIYTGAEIREKSYLHFSGTKILALTSEKKDEPVGSYPVITPAFIDPHCHIGMIRAGEPSAEAEANDQMDSLLPLSDALDSVMMDDSAFQDSIEAGVLYSCVVPGSGNIIGGRSAVIRNYGTNTTDALFARAGIKAAFGYNTMSDKNWKGTRPYARMGAVALLRKKLDEAAHKLEKFNKARGKSKNEIDFSAEEMVWRDLLKGKERLRVHVHKTDDIASLLRVVDEYGLKVTVEHACDVHEPEIFAELKKRRIPVVYGPIDSHAYKVELKHSDWRNLHCLLESGVEFGLMTDHCVMLQQQLLHQLRWFVRCGLDRRQALEIITRKNAEILGIDKILGTLAKGKWASFTGWNGDPFNLTSFPVAVYGEGEALYRE